MLNAPFLQIEIEKRDKLGMSFSSLIQATEKWNASPVFLEYM